MEFKPFYFEGNLRWGTIDTPARLKQLLGSYSYDLLRKAKRVDQKLHPYRDAFGFYAEYNDSYTLGDFIDDNNLQEFFK